MIKVGTSVLTNQGRFDRNAIDALCCQIADLLRRKIQVFIVSSGAIGSGMTLLRLKNRPKKMEELQAAAAIGQRYLMQCYEQSFSRYGFSTAQVLLTWDDLAKSKRYMNAKRTLHQIQAWGSVPIINENDTVATDEIRFGDNDRLSSLLAILVEADLLIILSDTDGLYSHGDKVSKAHRIPMVEVLSKTIFSHAKDSANCFTVGGMNSKLRSIHKCVEAGIPVFLAHGRERRVINRLMAHEDVGTFFVPNIRGKKAKDWVGHFLDGLKKTSV